MECYSFSKPGADHLEAGQKGQDQMFGIHGADHLALCLCDGCGSSPLGGEAAQYTAMMTARLFYYEFYDLLLARPDAVRRRLSAVLQPALRTIASQLGAPPEALATTILAFAADNSGRYLCAHLGDGCILLQPKGAPADSVSVISSPSCVAGTHATDLTMNADMMRHLKVYQSLLPTSGKFLLLTMEQTGLLRRRPGTDAALRPFRPGAGTLPGSASPKGRLQCGAHLHCLNGPPVAFCRRGAILRTRM